MYRKNLGLFTATAFLLVASVALADDQMNMKTASPKRPALTAMAGYRFELAGQVKPEGAGKSVVTVRLLHNGKPVRGAIVFQSTANMSPIGMGSMVAPVTSLGEQPPGTYRFEVANGAVWKKPDNWELTFAAKVQGESQTVHGSIVVKLSP